MTSPGLSTSVIDSRASAHAVLELGPGPFHFGEGDGAGLPLFESLPADVRVGRKPIFAVSLLASSTTASRQGSISAHTLMAASVLPQSPSRLDLLHRRRASRDDDRRRRGPRPASCGAIFCSARIERRAHGEAAAVELVLAEEIDDVAAHFLGEDIPTRRARAPVWRTCTPSGSAFAFSASSLVTKPFSTMRSITQLRRATARSGKRNGL